ncbi:MAG: DUF1643 domain-containing protein [Xanthomonadales bacterium]|nr:DUF1643 domain-containing protein [Xanthomonadales bacterium]
MVPDRRFERARGAVFSRSGEYRYALWRRWDRSAPWVLFIGLNPSTADAENNDPTIRRCIGFAREWQAGGVLVGNLFGWRSTDPRGLADATDPRGPGNRRWLARLAGAAGRVIACWGNPGHGSAEARWTERRFGGLEVLAVNRGGAPRHPLYVPGGTRPRRWRAACPGQISPSCPEPRSPAP